MASPQCNFSWVKVARFPTFSAKCRRQNNIKYFTDYLYNNMNDGNRNNGHNDNNNENITTNSVIKVVYNSIELYVHRGALIRDLCFIHFC